MSTFYVGQRVKQARGEANIGATGVVVSVDGDEVECRWDCGLPVTFNRNNEPGLPLPKGGLAWAYACDLEPITDPGRELVAWSECLWQPEGVSA